MNTGRKFYIDLEERVKNFINEVEVLYGERVIVTDVKFDYKNYCYRVEYKFQNANNVIEKIKLKII